MSVQQQTQPPFQVKKTLQHGVTNPIVEMLRGMVSSGYTRRKISAERAASQKLWRDISCRENSV